MVVRYASGALQNITRLLKLDDDLSDLAIEVCAAMQPRGVRHLQLVC